MSKTLCKKAIDAASVIGMFYLEKNNFDYKKTREEINRLRITKVSVEDKVFIETKRPGLLIGKRGQNIDALEKYIGMKISIVEAPASETDYLVPEPPPSLNGWERHQQELDEINVSMEYSATLDQLSEDYLNGYE